MKIPTITELIEEAEILSRHNRKTPARACGVEINKFVKWMTGETVPDARHTLLLLAWVFETAKNLKCEECKGKISKKGDLTMSRGDAYHNACFLQKFSRHRDCEPIEA